MNPSNLPYIMLWNFGLSDQPGRGVLFDADLGSLSLPIHTPAPQRRWLPRRAPPHSSCPNHRDPSPRLATSCSPENRWKGLTYHAHNDNVGFVILWPDSNTGYLPPSVHNVGWWDVAGRFAGNSHRA